MSLFVLCISLLIVAQHVSGNHVPIIRSWRLCDVIVLCWYVPWLRGTSSWFFFIHTELRCTVNHTSDTLQYFRPGEDLNNKNNIYLLQLGCYPVAVVILRVLLKIRPSCYHVNSIRDVWDRREGVFRGLGVVSDTKTCYPRDSNPGKACRQPLTWVIPVYSK